jgi:hydrogenase/urease accessory protein HupE
MKTMLCRAALTALAAIALAPTAAFAHPGDHTSMNLGAVARHIVTSPDHLAALAVASLVTVALAICERRRAAR